MVRSKEDKLIKVLQDKNISTKAKGLFAYLCFFEGEKVDEMQIKETDKAMQRFFKELKENGYVELKWKGTGRGKRYGII